MSDETLVSYAQNGEDVVLWRALGHVTDGFYVDVGGWDPDVDSVTRLFYERGWRGVDVEPVPEFAEKFRRRRPLNQVVAAAVTDDDVEEVVLHRFGTSGLSTVDEEFAERHALAGLHRVDIRVPALRLDDVLATSPLVGEYIHFLKVDVEGAEDQVLRSIDLSRWRPWVLVIEATEPNSTKTSHNSWEPLVLGAGYTFTLFDGLSRYYVSAEHPELAEKLSYPACPLDNFELARESELRRQLAELEPDLRFAREQAARWRGQAVEYWANAIARTQASEDTATQARNRAERATTQLGRVRENLHQARADRNKMRAEVKRLRARIQQLELDQATSRSSRRPLRAAVKKVTGT